MTGRGPLCPECGAKVVQATFHDGGQTRQVYVELQGVPVALIGSNAHGFVYPREVVHFVTPSFSRYRFLSNAHGYRLHRHQPAAARARARA